MKPFTVTRLTPREREVLVLISQGFVSKQIGPKLNCSSQTVDNHRARICAKLGATNSANAVWLGVLAGYLRPVPATV